jgi:hypothetical protein
MSSLRSSLNFLLWRLLVVTRIDGGMLHLGHFVERLVFFIALARAIQKGLANHRERDGCGAVSGGKRTGCREGGHSRVVRR